MYRLILDKNFGDSIHFYSLQFYNFLLLCFFFSQNNSLKKSAPSYFTEPFVQIRFN